LEFFVQQARDHQARILHTHFGNLGWANIAVAEKASMKHVVTFYGRDVNQIPRQDSRWHKRYKELFTHVDLVLCEGPYMKRCIIELGCPEDKVLVQHIGVRLDELNYQPREWDGQRPLRVLMAASFREKKGFPYGLEALGQMSKVIPLEVTIIGDSDKSKSSQREKQRILDTISRYHLTSKVKLLGYQPFSRLLEEAYQHHVFLSPSVTASDGDTEGGAPVSIIEMAATGMPIVSTIHCDIPEIIQHGHTGLLAEERDVVGLVKQLRWLVEHPDKWIQMTSRARQRIEMEYNADIQGKNLGKLYESLLDK
jgi:colanic acid/amylovoran biosynthesis glycosyltransferase